MGAAVDRDYRRGRLDRALSMALGRWRPRLAVHDPGQTAARSCARAGGGGDCLADVGVLRAEPEVFGLVASDPTVSRTIDRLADDADQVLAAVDTARAAARALVWKLAGNRAPDHGTDAARPLVIDVDATSVTAHSEKEGAAATFKKGSATIRCGVSLTTAGGDRGAGRGPAAARERRKQYCRRSSEGDPGGAAATARSSGRAPSRAEGPDQGRRRRGHPRSAGLAGEAALSYSVGFGLTQAVVDQLAALPATVWQPAYNADGEPRPGA
jgi:hypothetical protein